MAQRARIHHFVRSVASGQIFLCANVLYTLFSIPLALHYLSKSEFGLWALCTQIASVLALADLGMTSSLSRLLIDHKDQCSSPGYGGMVKTGVFVLTIQGALILMIGATLSLLAAPLLHVGAQFTDSFKVLMLGQALLTALAFPLQIFGLILYSHQRSDVWNSIQGIQLLVAFGLLWLGFAVGMGVYSFLLAAAGQLLSGGVMTTIVVQRLGFWIKWGDSPPPSLRQFQEMFFFAKDLFLITLGTQLINSTQVVIVTRILGLDAAAVWSVATKTFALVAQLLNRILNASIPGFAEMSVKNDPELVARYKQFFVLLSSVTIVGAILFATCNGPFIQLWINNRISWPQIDNILLAIWLMMLIQQSSHNSMMMTLKQIGFLKYIFLVEGGLFCVLGALGASWLGFAGVLLASIACTILVTYSYSWWRISRWTRIPEWHLWNEWNRIPLQVTLVLVPFVGVVVYLARRFEAGTLIQLVLYGLSFGILGGMLVLHLAMPDVLWRKIIDVLPPLVSRFALRLKPMMDGGKV